MRLKELSISEFLINMSCFTSKLYRSREIFRRYHHQPSAFTVSTRAHSSHTSLLSCLYQFKWQRTRSNPRWLAGVECCQLTNCAHRELQLIVDSKSGTTGQLWRFNGGANLYIIGISGKCPARWGKVPERIRHVLQPNSGGRTIIGEGLYIRARLDGQFTCFSRIIELMIRTKAEKAACHWISCTSLDSQVAEIFFEGA